MADLYYQLSTDELHMLLHSLDFSIPPFSVRQEVIFSEFEVFFAHLSRLSHILVDKVTALNVKWNDLADAFMGTAIEWTDFLW